MTVLVMSRGEKEKEAVCSISTAYGIVALGENAAREMGIEIDESKMIKAYGINDSALAAHVCHLAMLLWDQNCRLTYFNLPGGRS